MGKGIFILGKDDQIIAPGTASNGKMSAKPFLSFLPTRWFYLSSVLSTCAFLLCIATTQAAFASNNEKPEAPRNYQTLHQEAEPDRRPSPRVPPQAAIEACESRREGESCTFISREGTLEGECLAGIENVFACRPYRGVSSTTARKIAPSRRPEPPGTADSENKILPRAERAHVEKTAPSPSPQDGNRVMTKEQEPPRYPAPNVPIPIVESPLPANPTRPDDKPGHYTDCLASQLIIALIAAGLTGYIIFRYTTIPLRRLRKVTQQLAGGDLSARVGEGLVNRKNEVVELGRDVDRMAERIESLVGAQQRLIRDVSHELRSPLARLNVALELARQSAGPTHAAPFDRIERESERLNELIGQLLMLTKLESESGMAERVDVDIASLIEEIAQDVDFEARSNDCRVTAAAGKPLQLKGNRELLRQALENLVRNAVRYTAPGTAVEISLRKKESGGLGRAHIEVRDQGPGVPEAELQNIFRPFYRVNDARERQSGGAGVGLAISDRAVRLHGGSLRAFNAPGGGLIMELELPLT